MRISRNTISFGLGSVISMANASTSVVHCRLLQVKSHEVRKVATSFLFGGT